MVRVMARGSVASVDGAWTGSARPDGAEGGECGTEANERMLGLCVGRSYWDRGKSRWNL